MGTVANLDLNPERTAMEKLVVARALSDRSFDGRRYRRSVDECLAWVLRDGDRETAAYRIWDLLGGRRDRGTTLLALVAGDLGLGTDGTDGLVARYAPLFSANLEAARSRGQVVA